MQEDVEATVTIQEPQQETPQEPTIEKAGAYMLGECEGTRYFVTRKAPLTGLAEVDAKFERFPVLVFAPKNRVRASTPLVLVAGNACEPFHAYEHLLKPLLTMNLGLAVWDAPGAGLRRLAHDSQASPWQELAAWLKQNLEFGPELIQRYQETATADILTVAEIARKEEGFGPDQLALAGVGLGVCPASLAFCRDRLGARLIGLGGHPDLALALRRGLSWLGPLAKSPFGSITQRLVKSLAPNYAGLIPAVLKLHEAVEGGADQLKAVNAVTYAESVPAARKAVFLLDPDDAMFRLEDARAAGRLFAHALVEAAPEAALGGPEYLRKALPAVLEAHLKDWARY